MSTIDVSGQGKALFSPALVMHGYLLFQTTGNKGNNYITSGMEAPLAWKL